MKTLIFTILTIIILQNHAKANEAYIQCYATPEEYANNRLPEVKFPPLEIRMIQEDLITVFGEVKSQTFPVHQNYEIRLSGHIVKPGSSWVDGGTELIMSAELLQTDSTQNSRKVLDKDTHDSDNVRRPEELKNLQAGKITTTHYLANSDYLTDHEAKKEISKTQLVGVNVHCDLVHAQ